MGLLALLPLNNFFCPTPTYAFPGKEAWRPPDHARSSTNIPSAKIWVLELSSEVSFVSVLAMVLSEYWKRLEENFRNKITYFHNFSKWWNLQKKSSEKSSDIQLFAAGKFKGMALSGGHHAPLPPKAYFVEFYGRGGFLTSCLLWDV